MAVKLRLMRMGKKKQPTYRLVAADGRSPRDGRFIEMVGIYDPRAEPSVVRIDNVLESVAKAIVDDGGSVVVEVEESRNGISLRLNVSPDDMGRVIGRRGRTAQAIRTVVRAAAAREGLDAHVDISD